MSSHEAYVGVVIGYDEMTGTPFRERLIDTNQKDLMVAIMDKLVDLYAEEPGMDEFRIANSVHLIADYDEKEMQEKIEELTKFLDKKSVRVETMFLRMNLEVEDDEISDTSIEEI